MLAAGRIAGGPLAEKLVADPDPEVRAALAGAVTDHSIVQRLIVDPVESVRAAVITQIRNPQVLRLVAQSPDVETRRAIARHLDSSAGSNDLLMTLARDADPSVREVALGRIDARAVLELAADDNEHLSRSAMRFVSDRESLYGLSRHAIPHVQVGAVSQLRDVETLARIAGDVSHPRWSDAMARIDDEAALATLARSGSDRVAQAALARLPSGNTLASLAGDTDYRFQVAAAHRITDAVSLQKLADGPDGEVADRARSALAELGQRSERLATARLLAAGVVVAALAVAIVFTEARPLAVVIGIAVAVAYRAYQAHQLRRSNSRGEQD